MLKEKLNISENFTVQNKKRVWKFYNWKNNLVKNYSNKRFSDKELDILKLGLKTSFVPNKIPMEDLIVGIELGKKDRILKSEFS